jgi:hypothetical protein
VCLTVIFCMVSGSSYVPWLINYEFIVIFTFWFSFTDPGQTQPILYVVSSEFFLQFPKLNCYLVTFAFSTIKCCTSCCTNECTRNFGTMRCVRVWAPFTTGYWMIRILEFGIFTGCYTYIKYTMGTTV